MDGGAGADEHVHVRLQLQGTMQKEAKQQATKQQVDIEAMADGQINWLRGLLHTCLWCPIRLFLIREHSSLIIIR